MTQSLTVNPCSICKGEGYIWGLRDGYDAVSECECQTGLKVERYLKNSGVKIEEYREKSLDTFLPDTKEANTMKSLAIKFLEDEQALGLGYFGNSGTGKTHICIAVCQELTKKKLMPHLYFAYRKEIQQLKAAFYDQEEFNRLMGRWTGCRVLYVDDFLKFAQDRNGNPQIQDLQIMFDIINTRYLNKSITIYSSEYTLNDIKKIDAALASRIYEMVGPYRMKCEDDNRRFRRIT